MSDQRYREEHREEPLEVRWLCEACHTEWHKNNKPIYKEGENV